MQGYHTSLHVHLIKVICFVENIKRIRSATKILIWNNLVLESITAEVGKGLHKAVLIKGVMVVFHFFRNGGD